MYIRRNWVSKKGRGHHRSDQAPERALSKQLHAAPYRRTVVNLALKFSGFDRLVELKSNMFIQVL
jgi:hypothetical protein